jgi:hypothetical protein
MSTNLLVAWVDAMVAIDLFKVVFINPPTVLWTRDKQLRKVAGDLGIHATLA